RALRLEPVARRRRADRVAPRDRRRALRRRPRLGTTTYSVSMSSFPDVRLRRFRRSSGLRGLVRETHLRLDQFVMPLFVAPEALPNDELPGMSRHTVDGVVREVEELVRGGVGAVMLFGIPAEKDEQATGAWEEDGIVQQALRALRPRFRELVLVTDVCLCEYTSHGHCGVVVDGEVHNDRSLERLARRGRRGRRRAERHDGRPRGGDPRRARRRRLRRDADPRLLGEVRVGVLRPVPRGCRLGAVVRRPARLPDGSRERARGAPRVRARRRRGRRRDHGQARAPVPRRDPCGTRGIRPADRRVQRLRRVRDDQGGGAERLARRARRGARVAGRDQAGRRGSRRLVLDERPRAVAVIRSRSDLYRRAVDLIPGGVNSPVRAMRAVGLDEPFFVEHGEGAYLYDVDGNRYLDWVLSWGPLVFGHADAETVEAVRDAATRGTSFGAPTEAEVELAQEIVDAVPSVEKVRLVSSGTEAAMSALRLARAFTKRDRIIKF